MRKWRVFVLMAAFVLAIPAVYHASPSATPEPSQQEAVITGPNYLYIAAWEVGPDQVPNEAIEEVKGWVRIFRETGEYKSVRMFIHNTGPRFALYVLFEPNSWQSIETGMEKALEAIPEWMANPMKFSTHWDNLLSEIPVE